METVLKFSDQVEQAVAMGIVGINPSRRPALKYVIWIGG